MESDDDVVSASERQKRRRWRVDGFFLVLIRWCTAVVFSVISVSLFLGFVVSLIADLSIRSHSVSVPSQCRIVSSSVDLRSSKVCEIGLLNYKTKDVFYPYERNRFRCRYDYYWASVFKVEFRDQIFGHKRIAWAEAPNEALPLDCRPNFGVAWLTKDKFKVNETYDCWYSSSMSKVGLYDDGFSSCRAQDPSKIQIMEQYFIWCRNVIYSWLYIYEKAIYWRWETVAGLVTGVITSVVTLIGFTIMQQFIRWLFKPRSVRTIVCLNQACLFVAYFSVIGWLSIQYVKRLSLPQIFNALKTR